MARLSIGIVILGLHDRDHFVVMSKLGRGSLAGNVASILSYYVRRRWESDYVKILEYVAAKAGLTPEETFERLLAGESVDDLVADDGISIPSPEDSEA